jgi:hypothetical protein
MRIYFFIVMFFLLSASSVQSAASSCEQEAFAWCSALRYENISQEDQTIILNVTYWSWARSTMLVQAQKAVADYMHSAHGFIQTSMAARINPARLSSIAGCSTDEWACLVHTYENNQKELVEKLRAYRYASATYAQCIEYILKTDKASDVIVECAEKLRKHARAHMAVAMKSQALSLNKVLETLGKVFDCVRFGNTTRGFLDGMLNFAATDFFNAFGKWDRQYSQCNDVVWESLVKSYALSNIVWDMSETARIHFYKVYHRMAVRALCGDGVRHEISSAFDPDGFVQAEKRKRLLTAV